MSAFSLLAPIVTPMLVRWRRRRATMSSMFVNRTPSSRARDIQSMLAALGSLSSNGPTRSNDVAPDHHGLEEVRDRRLRIELEVGRGLGPELGAHELHDAAEDRVGCVRLVETFEPARLRARLPDVVGVEEREVGAGGGGDRGVERGGLTARRLPDDAESRRRRPRAVPGCRRSSRRRPRSPRSVAPTARGCCRAPPRGTAHRRGPPSRCSW